METKRKRKPKEKSRRVPIGTYWLSNLLGCWSLIVIGLLILGWAIYSGDAGLESKPYWLHRYYPRTGCFSIVFGLILVVLVARRLDNERKHTRKHLLIILTTILWLSFFLSCATAVGIWIQIQQEQLDSAEIDGKHYYLVVEYPAVMRDVANAYVYECDHFGFWCTEICEKYIPNGNRDFEPSHLKLNVDSANAFWIEYKGELSCPKSDPNL